MSYGRTGEDVKLRINHRGGADAQRQTQAVAIISRIPDLVLVAAYVTQPTALPQSDQAQNTALGPVDTTGPARYVFERGARVTPRTSFGAAPGSPTRGKVLIAGPSAPAYGSFGQIQVEPAWTALAPAVSGSLVPKGREEHSFTLPDDLPNEVPDAQVPAAELLRIRLVGENAETAEAQDSLAGGELTYSGQLLYNAGADEARNIAPGSVVFSFADIGGNAVTARDRGDGTIVGQAAAPNTDAVIGTIDYVTGAYSFDFSAAAGAGAPTASYERDTLYRPLDVRLEWDAVLAHG